MSSKKLVKTGQLLALICCAIFGPAAIAEPAGLTLSEALTYSPAEPCVYVAPKGSGDPTTAKRNERKAAKKYRHCVRSYQRALVEDFQSLNKVAGQGLGPAEAETILAHMANIQQLLQQQPDSGDKPEFVLPTTTTDFYDRAHGR